MKILLGFVAGVVFMLAINGLSSRPAPATLTPIPPVAPAGVAPAVVAPAEPAAIPAPVVPTPTIVSTTAVEAAVEDLRGRNLEIPVQGVERRALQPSYDDPRGTDRRHHGIDILAPRNTPVMAVEDGVIAKLFASVAGGLTVYQFDPTQRYTYYYAHLERYADALVEGMHVTRGQVLGYVGTSGNAPKDTPHLHFEISILTDARQWWKAAPVDPYRVLR